MLSDVPDIYKESGKQNSSVRVKLRANGSVLFRIQKNKKNQISIPYSSLILDNNKYILDKAKLSKQLSVGFNEDVKIIDIKPDSIIFNIVKLHSKKVPIISKTKLNFAPMHDNFGQIHVSPDSVIIKGSAKNIRKIKSVNTALIEPMNLSDTLIKNVDIIQNKSISYFPKTVKLTIPVERYTEKSLNVDITVIDLPDSLKFISFPKQVQVSFRAGLNNYDSISSSDFSFTVNYKNLIKKKSSIFSPTMQSAPRAIKNIKISPKSFEYFLKKKLDLKDNR